MNKTILILGTLFVLLATLSMPTACYFDSEEDLYGTTACDTANIRFSVEIKAILEANCNKCHVETATEYSGYDLGSYDAVKNFVDDGKLVDRTNDSASPMPPKSDGGLMSACDRQKIKAWVNAGALNN